ncbi:hypothetical protein MSG28_016184 [Choristoneura fumiferana]|uniref:Uncharacterized protein n=1 Tax=Choristoneura fumiferana TaxID=7141 RepID=A0ACC0K648_CHOFU|nr:hypothetical protein MSG28_016184 [Choristoneura fumiferana]
MMCKSKDKCYQSIFKIWHDFDNDNVAVAYSCGSGWLTWQACGACAGVSGASQTWQRTPLVSARSLIVVVGVADLAGVRRMRGRERRLADLQRTPWSQRSLIVVSGWLTWQACGACAGVSGASQTWQRTPWSQRSLIVWSGWLTWQACGACAGVSGASQTWQRTPLRRRVCSSRWCAEYSQHEKNIWWHVPPAIVDDGCRHSNGPLETNRSLIVVVGVADLAGVRRMRGRERRLADLAAHSLGLSVVVGVADLAGVRACAGVSGASQTWQRTPWSQRSLIVVVGVADLAGVRRMRGRERRLADLAAHSLGLSVVVGVADLAGVRRMRGRERRLADLAAHSLGLQRSLIVVVGVADLAGVRRMRGVSGASQTWQRTPWSQRSLIVVVGVADLAGVRRMRGRERRLADLAAHSLGLSVVVGVADLAGVRRMRGRERRLADLAAHSLAPARVLVAVVRRVLAARGRISGGTCRPLSSTTAAGTRTDRWRQTQYWLLQSEM